MKPATRARRAEKPTPAMTGERQVDASIAAAAPAARPMLRELRGIIRACAPGALEKLSYRMPYYHLHGRLTYFAAFSRHVSLFVMGSARLRFAEEIEPYRSGASTLRFPLGTRVPARLVAKLIRARIHENTAKKQSAIRR